MARQKGRPEPRAGRARRHRPRARPGASSPSPPHATRESDVNKSWTVVRIIAGLGALPCTIGILLILRGQIRHGFELQNGFFLWRVLAPVGGAFGAAIAVAAMLGWWLAIRGDNEKSRRRIGYALLGGVVLGSVRFFAGFFGPLILTPANNLGPLLGIFLTGPLGFVVGAVIGVVYALLRAR